MGARRTHKVRGLEKQEGQERGRKALKKHPQHYYKGRACRTCKLEGKIGVFGLGVNGLSRICADELSPRSTMDVHGMIG